MDSVEVDVSHCWVCCHVAVLGLGMAIWMESESPCSIPGISHQYQDKWTVISATHIGQDAKMWSTVLNMFVKVSGFFNLISTFQAWRIQVQSRWETGVWTVPHIASEAVTEIVVRFGGAAGSTGGAGPRRWRNLGGWSIYEGGLCWHRCRLHHCIAKHQ